MENVDSGFGTRKWLDAMFVWTDLENMLAFTPSHRKLTTSSNS